MRRTKEDAEITRQKILKTAIKVFNKNGFTATKLEDIAKKAGVTRGAIYHHFENKKELFTDICVQNRNKMMSMIEDIYGEKLNPLQKLKMGLNELINKLENDKEFRDTEELMLKTDINNELTRAQIKDSGLDDEICKLRMVLENAQKVDQLNDKFSVDQIALSVVTFYYGMVSLWIVNPPDIDIRSNSRGLIDLFFEGIANKKLQ